MNTKLDEILNRNIMRQYEETSTTWTLSMLALNYGYSIAIYDLYFDTPQMQLAIRYLKAKGITPKYLIVSKSNEKEKSNSEIPIINIKKVKPLQLENMFVIVTRSLFGTRLGVRKRIEVRGINKYLIKAGGAQEYAPFDIEFVRDRCAIFIDWAKRNKKKMNKVLESLNDNISKQCFLEIVRSTIENDKYMLPEGPSSDKYWAKDEKIYRQLNDEILLNCGACTGDTILHYLATIDKFKKIYAFEGDSNMIKALNKNLGYLPQNIREKIEVREEFLGIDPNQKIEFSDNSKVTLINMDIEGAELNTLQNICNILKEQRPVLAVCCYHKPSHLVDIVLYIKENISEYNFFMRKYVGCDLNALNEYVIYAVPIERMFDENGEK